MLSPLTPQDLQAAIQRRERKERWQLHAALVLVLVLMATGWLRQRQPSSPPPLPAEMVQAWMLESAHGIGPRTSAQWLQRYRAEGFSVLPPRVQADLAGLICADIPAAENAHSSAR
ncbi:MAG: hypothetical protein EA402_11210 [Planctomycetota bacterium]|nr:MAG: hypothetical protein EA402_11210 [Planctomycetota bacterium]